MAGRLQDKVAIVTGAAGGFGAAIAERYAQEGARVVVADMQQAAGEAVAARLGARFQRCDVSRAEDVQALVEATVAAYGRLDIVVNNAGVTHRNQPALAVGEEEFDRVFRVNVKSLFHMSRSAVPAMRANPGGCGGVFVNVASTTGNRPGPGLCWYSASKGAVITASKGLALELARERIRVCVVNPMLGETGLLEQFMGQPDTPENRERFLARIPLGRLTRPADVAEAAVYLASDEAAYLTGTCLEVDGGRSL
jgi:NAD(P)-dependent dehydrogenase (short-subunit alcohol dehydrogenase family)